VLTATATTVSWIPSESVSGLGRLGFEAGVGLHYDNPPPMELTADDHHDRSRFRLVNRLAAWVDVSGEQIVDCGYQEASHSELGLTTVSLGRRKVELVNVALPDLRREPTRRGTHVEFIQTAGGRTVIPFPRRVPGAPHVQFSAPIIWTTISLTMHADGSAESRLAGASAFPRHWLYDDAGHLSTKAALADFKEWTRSSFGMNTPWQGVDREALVATAETALERTLSEQIMRAGRKPQIMRLKAGDQLTRQGDRGDQLFLLLNGVLGVEVDGHPIAEAGPGALLGERALLEEGRRTATLRALTPAVVAITATADIDRADLIEIARGHHAEKGSSDSQR
jgi:hypothetical protein